MDRSFIDKIFTFEDKNGNFFSCKDGKLTLQLKSESRVRKIGEITQIKNLVIYKKYEDERFIHRKTNSWSVPVDIFEKCDGFWFHTKQYNYKILKSKAKQNMSYLSFRKAGYEDKVYIPLQLWSTKPIK